MEGNPLKLAAKIILIVTAGVLILLAVDGYLTVQREISLFELDMEHDALLLGHAVRGMLSDVWVESGRKRVLQLVDDINRGERDLEVSWVDLDREPISGSALSVQPDSIRALMKGRGVTLTGVTEASESAFYTYVPVGVEGRVVGAIEISESRQGLRDYIRTTIIRRLILIVVMLFVSTAVIVILGIVFIGHPLRSLLEITQRMGAGDLGASVRLHGHDELDELADGLNLMGGQLKASREQLESETERRIAAIEQLRHEDRLRTVGQLASGIAHELGTPLNVIAGRAGLISSGDMSQSEIAESAEVIRVQADRMTKIVGQVLDFARRRSSGKTRVDLKACAFTVQRLLQPLAQKRGIDIAIGRSDTANVVADSAQIEQVLSNLTFNAIQASPRGGQVEISTGSEIAQPPKGSSVPRGTYAFVTVQDQGEGISEEDIPRLFEPFFTTKDVGEGTGLGLSIACSIIEDHGGWINVESSRGQGSRFTVYLPEE